MPFNIQHRVHILQQHRAIAVGQVSIMHLVSTSIARSVRRDESTDDQDDRYYVHDVLRADFPISRSQIIVSVQLQHTPISLLSLATY